MSMEAFNKLSYGLHLISSERGGRPVGCVVNTLGQVTVSPLQLAVTIHKDNETCKAILESGRFTGAVLGEHAGMELIGRFGFQSSAQIDKFAGFSSALDCNGIRYITEQTVARFSCTVKNTLDVGTHILFIGQVDESEVLDAAAAPMTYLYYHAVKKGLTPPKASSYRPPQAEEKPVSGWRCTICGYIYEGETLPENYICPVCKKGADVFERL